ncbi:B3 domain-containing transcription repressor VAL2-like isoform X1 [Salvia splendens]|uniref:B3 domain-containing transcription repressor VAL2-like isoform X1 n=1 Tax=Salvia splendens TaxID=180675 RepID=UPI0011019B16|nr:B3 domain-containing transcription repressor VAL2-like isoform X1 [Salvia splendens]XP_041996552.1 B3 domain-containing transcription repressor VAL2-like isoform X1 [Salvia splendens]XP_041996560.1 B3 domain-containing transcription repressor VAL2-like isoform X1 [Salvia splendens]
MEGGGLCMNGVCSASSSLNWTKGWPLRSGGFATLCHDCGTAYKDLVFCETFHLEETGWRECTSCGKRLHCGCIASSTLLELLDTGGVNCAGCSKSFPHSRTPFEEKHKACDLSTENGTDRNSETMVPVQSGDDTKMDCQEYLLPSQNANVTSRKLEEALASGYKLLSSSNQPPVGPSKSYDMFQESRSLHKSLVETNLSISLSASSNSNTMSGVITEERQLNTAISSFQQGCRPHHLLPRVPTILAAGVETNSSSISQLRVARPPVEGRVKSQLLPRYWPRITDQELQQISGDSNSTIVPLFEKVLSASDAGRIGRLVLPKACAEAYFPPISQPEGLPLRIQDLKGKEWVFQFRFWPNNNSRMYVLEGVTPCIQSMQLQAGDTVTFSRMDPEGKLLMGFRKASNSVSVQKQDSLYPIDMGAFQGETVMGNAESLPLISGYSGLLQSLKGSRSPSMTLFPKHVFPGNISPQITEMNVCKSGGDNLSTQALVPSERKRRNIGTKSKRLLIDSHDSLELRLSWEEVQDLLRPPPTVKPSTVSVEDHEIEEFDEPPVFGKRSIFIVRLPGEQEQWTQCDSCLKWRKLPLDLLLPPKWTCQDNIDDPMRCSCSAPDEMDSRGLESLVRMHKDFTKWRALTSLKPVHGQEYQENVETQTNGAPAGGNMSEPGSSSVATTTRHPRHRPGCSCIVCIQPPSGKGKHKPTCVCNVCMTVKRRFKTLMMRKKKRQSEREAEIAQRNQSAAKEEAEVDSIPSQAPSDNAKRSESENLLKCQSCDGPAQENANNFNGGLDLNCCPFRQGTAGISMMSLLQEASLPLDTYLRQNGLTSLVFEQQESSTPVIAQASGETTTPPAQDDAGCWTAVQEQEGSSDLSDKDQREDDTS